MASSEDSDDPWEWDVDRVVQELCTDNRTWQPRSSSLSTISDPASLEFIFREQEVTGSVLLVDVDIKLLKEDFGIKVLGRRAFVMSAIDQLRMKSLRYQTHVLEQQPEINASKHKFSMQLSRTSSGSQSPRLSKVPRNLILDSIRNGSSDFVTEMNGLSNGGENNTTQAHDGMQIDDIHQLKPQRKKLKTMASNEYPPNTKEANLHALTGSQLHSEALATADENLGQDLGLLSGDDNTPVHDSALVPVGETVFNINLARFGKKRKRISPTFVSGIIDPHLEDHIPTAADILRPVPKSEEDFLEKPKPGVAFIGLDGRKRMVPIQEQDPVPGKTGDNVGSQNSSLVLENHLFAKVSSSLMIPKHVSKTLSAAPHFLGKRKKEVDSIFYEGTRVGQEISHLDNETEFSLGLRHMNSGHRLYVYNVMKYFLGVTPHNITHNGSPHAIIVPYSRRLIPKYQQQSLTIYCPGHDGEIVARRAINSEASAHKIHSNENERLAVFNPLNRSILEYVGTSDDWDPSNLEKYAFLEGGDKVLPLYDESDEENEYDLVTWNEIEEEFGEKYRPEKGLKKPFITEDEVHETIDAGIAEIVARWAGQNISRRERDAWRLWHRARHLKNNREQILAAQKDLAHVEEYIGNIRDRIASEFWTSQSQVRKQFGSMETSLCTREELRWKINVLEQKKCPERPFSVRTVPSTKKLPVDVEICEGESILSDDTKTGSYDDDMDGFIINDDTPSLGEQEMHEYNLADSENEDEEDLDMLDGIPSNNSIPSCPRQPSCKKIARIWSQKNLDDELPCVSLERSGTPNSVNNTPTSSISPENYSTPLDVKSKKFMLPDPASNSSKAATLIDLTLISSDDDVAPRMKHAGSTNPIALEDSRLMLVNKKGALRPKFYGSPSGNEDEENLPHLHKLPPYSNPGAIAKYSYDAWRKVSDKERLLIKLFYEMNFQLRIDLLQAFFDSDLSTLWSQIKEVIEALSVAGRGLESMHDHKFRVLIFIIRIFTMYMDCTYYRIPINTNLEIRLKARQLKRVILAAEDFQRFYGFCIYLPKYLGSELQQIKAAPSYSQENAVGHDNDERSQYVVDRISGDSNTSEYETLHHGTPKKRKKLIKENKEARDMREQDRQRIAAHEERRRKLQRELARASKNGAPIGQHIINDAAAEGQKYIHVHHHIAKSIKKHQIDGVRFLWNQIVADEKYMQGCLLAHTMGLGKTMQAITLLVAIAEASRSSDPSFYSQVPPSLRISKTLILCPATLVDNWMDELLVWVPENLLGELRKVDSTIKTRYRTIAEWHKHGGVLVINYEMFRTIICDKKMRSEEHELVLEQLLNGPNIIIADEAHKMKNASASITAAATKFRSKSRIALTGSPLANNVEEYHTMIEWVAPNYLGPIVEFRAKYVYPIQAGLWTESTRAERRQSLKMLNILNSDLAPKVHRADMSVLKDDLPPKKEFVITVPLTKIQRNAYIIYVRSMLGGKAYATTKSGEVTSTTLWNWLAMLTLLCNHPHCFRQKLQERMKDASEEARAGSAPNLSNAIDIDDETDDPSVWKAGVSEELVLAEERLFAEETDNLKSVLHGNKIKALCVILDLCKKAGDKALVFSRSIPTLDFLENLFKSPESGRQPRRYFRLDGRTPMAKRQADTKAFNNGDFEVYLISTTAGGLGLNLQGANRVIIFDFSFNPILEEQAIGRAYRIGQVKPVFVYRLIAGGTFETNIHNKTVFKTQLASRIVDKKKPVAVATKKINEFLFEPKHVPEGDLNSVRGMDTKVLDKIIADIKADVTGQKQMICSIIQTDLFAVDDDEKLTPEEEKEVQAALANSKLSRSDPEAYRQKVLQEKQQQHYVQFQMQRVQGKNGSEGHLATASPRLRSPNFNRPVAPILPPGFNGSLTPILPTKTSGFNGSPTPILPPKTSGFSGSATSILPPKTSSSSGSATPILPPETSDFSGSATPILPSRPFNFSMLETTNVQKNSANLPSRRRNSPIPGVNTKIAEPKEVESSSSMATKPRPLNPVISEMINSPSADDGFVRDNNSVVGELISIGGMPQQQALRVDNSKELTSKGTITGAKWDAAERYKRSQMESTPARHLAQITNSFAGHSKHEKNISNASRFQATANEPDKSPSTHASRPRRSLANDDAIAIERVNEHRRAKGEPEIEQSLPRKNMYNLSTSAYSGRSSFSSRSNRPVPSTSRMRRSPIFSAPTGPKNSSRRWREDEINHDARFRARQNTRTFSRN